MDARSKELAEGVLILDASGISALGISEFLLIPVGLVSITIVIITSCVVSLGSV